MDKLLLNNSRKNIYKIIKNFNANLIHNCDIFKNFKGRDIDTLYKKGNFSKITYKNIIIRNLDNNSLRIYINHLKNLNFLNIDINDISNLPEPIRLSFNKYFNKKIYCKHTKLKHLDKKSIIFYKLVKYFYFGKVHSDNQLFDLKKELKKLDKNNFSIILNSTEEALPNEDKILKKFLFWNIKKFNKDKNNKNFFLKKKLINEKKRRIFSGKLRFNRIFFSSKFVYALLFGSNAKWNCKHNPMPAISIVGNDGSGKTTVVDYIRKNFSKMDPLILNMKTSDPFFSITLKIRKKLKKLKNATLINFLFLKKFIIYFGEFLDLFDRYIKYRIGIAWADSGHGLTIFERYPTDRIRGEFPNFKNKILPLEQFFPFPDGIIYLDVLPKHSVLRKKKDGHTLKEMTSKRKNYLSLLNEFDEFKILSPSNNVKNNIIKIKDYIFKIYLNKKKQTLKSQKFKRVKWKKNFNRVLSGLDLKKSNKEGFYE
jgi:thymidylate kinase